MNVLAIESSGPIGSVAVLADDHVLFEDFLQAGMEHGRLLVWLLDQVVKRAGLDKRKSLDLIAVSQGPGSFTGLRVGITCTKILAAMLGKPVVGVCSFDAMVENAPDGCERVITALDAKRGEVYAAAYEHYGETWGRTNEPTVMKPREAAALLKPPFYIMGDAIKYHSKIFSRRNCRPLPENLWRIRANVVARLGRKAFLSGRVDEPVGLQPTYLRLPDAEEKRLAREREKARD